MLLAQRSKTDFLEIYIALMDEYLKTHDRELRTFFSTILKETRSLAKKEISYFEIDSDIYPIVTYLEEKDADYFKEINLNEIDYEEVRGFLKVGAEI